MKNYQLGNSFNKESILASKTLQEFNQTLKSLKRGSNPIETVLVKTECIKPTIQRKASLHPFSGIEKPRISEMRRSHSIETPKEKLYTGNVDEYSIGQTLGYGAYAVVKLSTHTPTKNQYAIKTYEKSKLLDPQRKKNVINEIKILKCISHPHIIKMKEAIDSSRQIHIVMEYVGGCSL